jgi:hypothetical protein
MRDGGSRGLERHKPGQRGEINEKWARAQL